MPDNIERLRKSVLERFANTAESPDQEKTFWVGPESAKQLGYDAEEVAALPASVTEDHAELPANGGVGSRRARIGPSRQASLLTGV